MESYVKSESEKVSNRIWLHFFIFQLRVLNALLLSDNVKAKLLKFNLVKFCVTIDDSKLCDICQRRINRSVFVHTEKGQIVHYACHNKTLSGSESVDN